MTAYAVAILVSPLLAASAAAAPGPAAHHGRPVIRTAPASAPVARRAHHACQISRPSAGRVTRHSGLVWVRPNPTGAVLVWEPGLNSKRCRAVRTVGTARTARRVAQAIEQAKRVPKGTYSCPFDDATRVRLYLSYAHAGDEFVRAPLSGCRFFSAPGRGARFVMKQLDRALKPIAPGAWKRYL